MTIIGISENCKRLQLILLWKSILVFQLSFLYTCTLRIRIKNEVVALKISYLHNIRYCDL